jgi:hypothetical protein
MKHSATRILLSSFAALIKYFKPDCTVFMNKWHIYQSQETDLDHLRFIRS